MKWLSSYPVVVVVVVATVTHGKAHDKWHYRMQGDGDMHGGVPMGIPDDQCDNARDHLGIDWDYSREDFKCRGSIYTNEADPAAVQPAQCTTLLDPPTHVCLPTPIDYRDPIPTAGAHRPLWAKFGEYWYLPRQRWLHNLEHGCAVFLYHPCADPGQVQELRSIASRCLRKHIVTPLKELSKETPFAVLTYGCKLLLPYVDANRIVEFLQVHALDAPEAGVTEDGQYEYALRRPASRYWDDAPSTICDPFPRKPAKVAKPEN